MEFTERFTTPPRAVIGKRISTGVTRIAGTILGATCRQFNWLVDAYCLMTNHYHLLVETPDANLFRGMRYLNGAYTQHFNRSHVHFVSHLNRWSLFKDAFF